MKLKYYRKMKKFLVIGNPIEHSLSPVLHNYWFKLYNIEAQYEKKQLSEKDLILPVLGQHNGSFTF